MSYPVVISDIMSKSPVVLPIILELLDWFGRATPYWDQISKEIGMVTQPKKELVTNKLTALTLRLPDI